MGDWLYMSAFETSLAERSLPILDILTAVTRKMTEGELLQLTLLGRTDISEEQYFDVIARKTAYLFSACCEIGSLLGGADPDAQRMLRDYGMNLGIAFQLVDDLLDATSSEEVLGKPAGADLLEGKVSLPMIFLLQREPPKAATKMFRVTRFCARWKTLAHWGWRANEQSNMPRRRAARLMVLTIRPMPGPCPPYPRTLSNAIGKDCRKAQLQMG